MKLTIYSQKNCKPCTEMKSRLEEHGVPYQEITVGAGRGAELEHKKNYAQLIKKGSRVTPTLFVDDNIEVIGYDDEGKEKVGDIIKKYLSL